MKTVAYIHLMPGDPLPNLAAGGAFTAILVIEAETTDGWQRDVSEWLVRSRCRWMMAWGKGCSSWDDSVDDANIKLFPDHGINQENFVFTSWHDDESLADVFRNATINFFDLSTENRMTYVVHISASERSEDFISLFNAAQLDSE